MPKPEDEQMYIHKEGNFTLLVTGGTLLAAFALIYSFYPSLAIFAGIVFLGLFLFIVSFFRNPNRSVVALTDGTVLAPADGKIVVIEETTEDEYLKDKRLQVSIFMSPLNVHVNRNPISGVVDYYKYHPGKYLAAWNPKASTENERTTTVYNYGKDVILMRQIAGALARRIVCYLDKGQKVTQGEEMGFIKFGSRVDLYFPLGTEVIVEMDQMVQGNLTKIAKLPS